MALLEVENLKVYYFTRAGAVKAVDDISFSMDIVEIAPTEDLLKTPLHP